MSYGEWSKLVTFLVFRQTLQNSLRHFSLENEFIVDLNENTENKIRKNPIDVLNE